MYKANLVLNLLSGLAVLLGAPDRAHGQINSSHDYRLVAKHSGKVLDVFDASIGNGARTQQFTWHGGDNQRWRLELLEDGHYRIIANHSGKVLDIEGGAGALGNQVSANQYDWNGGSNQRWRLIPAGGGYYNIVAKHSSKCLDVEGGAGATGDRVRVQQYDCNGGDNQKWLLDPITTQSIRLRMMSLKCDKTTEAGADEVYLLVYGRRSDGKTFQAKEPGGHWDMNDGDQPWDNPNGDSRGITSKQLFVGDLPSGQSWSLGVMILEEDGGTTKDMQQIGAYLLKESGDPYGVTVGTLLSLLTKLGVWATDTDDYIGSFAVQVSNNNGNITSRWKSIDRVTSSEGDSNSLEYKFRMGGDGSNYIGHYRIFK
jgi:hypothetical protein